MFRLNFYGGSHSEGRGHCWASVLLEVEFFFFPVCVVKELNHWVTVEQPGQMMELTPGAFVHKPIKYYAALDPNSS